MATVYEANEVVIGYIICRKEAAYTEEVVIVYSICSNEEAYAEEVVIWLFCCKIVTGKK